MNKKIIKRLALFLAVLISFECLPVEALAVNNNANNATQIQPFEINEEETPLEVVGELEDQRSAYMKSFRLSDGTISAVEYESDVHYLDEQGKWHPIDNSLVFEDVQGNTGAEAEAASEARDAAVVSTENLESTVEDPQNSSVAQQENSDLKDELTAAEKESQDTDFEAAETESQAAEQQPNEDSSSQINVQDDAAALTAQNESSNDVEETDGYKTAAGNVNFKFAKNANQKNLVRIEQGKYKFSLSLLKRNKNKNVEIENTETFADENSDDPIDQMSAPNISSSVIYKNIQDGVDLQYITSGSNLKENIIVNQVKNDYEFSFEIKAKDLGIKQAENTIILYDVSTNETVYEMPAMYMTDNAGMRSDDVTYTLSQKNKKKYTLTITADASWMNAAEREFPVIIDPSLDTNNTGSGMQKTEIFNYYSSQGGAVYSGGTGFWGYDSSKDYMYRHRKQTQSWNNLPAISDTVLDYRDLSKSTNSQYIGWDITELVKKRYKANDDAYSSFALVNYDESKLNSKTCAKATINQSNNSTTGRFSDGHPILQIIYRDTRGIEDYYTNTSQSIGQAGTAYIGDYNNQLTLIKNDLTNNGSAMDFVLSHVYNSATSYANYTTDSNMHTKLYTNMYIGNGWRLSIQETVIPFTIGSTKYYIYSDGDGTEHYFYYNKNDKKYVDEDGLNLSLAFWTSSQKYEYITMQDKKGNQKVFVNGYLTKIEDAHQNKIYLEYNGQSYSNSGTAWSPKIESSTATPTNRVTGIVQIHRNGTKSQIATLQYGYYWRPDFGILNVTEYSKTSNNSVVTGAKMSIGYGDMHRKKFRDYGADATADTDDDIISYTTFDNAGRTVNTISLDRTQTKLFGADSSAYTINDTSDSGSSKSNNRVTADVAIGQQAINLLLNSSGEKGTGTTAENWSSTCVGTRTNCAVRDNDYSARTGKKSFRIWMDDISDEQETRIGGHFQKVYLKSNTEYTFSGYVNTSNVRRSVDVYAKILAPNGKEIAKSKVIDYQTPEEIEDGWERISVTFTASSAGEYSCGIYAEHGHGLTIVDDLQLEEANACSSYNMINDGSIEYQGTWNVGDGEQSIDQTNVYDGSHSMKLTGAPTNTSQFWQTMPVNQSSDNTYVLSGWAKANSVSDVSTTDNTTRFFGFYANVIYTDGKRDVYVFSFNPDITDWQYLSAIIVPKSQGKIISTITVFGLYNKNVNAAWFDNIALKKEPAQTYTYDKEGNLVAVNQKGNTPLNSVYAAGTADLQSESDGNGTYKYEHNAAHDVTSVTNDNVKLSLTYDSSGNTTGTTLVNTKNDASEQASNKMITSTAEYSDDGNYLTGQTDSSGIHTSYSNNTLRGVVASSTTNGVTTNYTYEFESDRQTWVYIGGKLSVQYFYENGNLAKIQRGGYFSGQKILQDYNYTYDSFGNKTSVSVGDRTLAQYEYAPNNGNLIKTTYGNGNTVELVYDIFDRVVEEKYNGTVKYRYVYNGEGDLAKKIELKRSGLSLKEVNAVNYEYDSLGRLIHSSEERIEDGKTTEVQRSEHIYDGENRISKQSWSVGGEAGRSENYQYSTVDGTLQSMKTANGENVSFHYDALNQLTWEKLPQQGLEYTYVYDMDGNIREVKTTNTKTNKTTTNTYAYTDSNWADLLTSYNGTNITYDAVGNPLSYNNGTAWKFTWENAHDLATAKGNGKSVSYHYDMDGVRDSKTVDGVAHEYITQGGNVTLERWNDGEEKRLEFIYDNGGAPYSVIYSHGSQKDTYYYILNQQGDVIRIVNSSGATVTDYTYNGWGEILKTDNKIGDFGNLNPIRYRGYYYDSELNMYYLQSRHYDPVMKRMICADDESLTADSTLNNNNLFAYCDNNPVCKADIEGEIPAVVVGAIIGATANVALQMLTNRFEGNRLTYGLGTAAVSGAVSGAISTIDLPVRGVMIANGLITGVASAAQLGNQSLKTQKRVLR